MKVMFNQNWFKGIGFFSGDTEAVSQILIEHAVKKELATVHLVNVFTLHLARQQRSLYANLLKADYCLSDSRFIELKLKRSDGVCQVRGEDLFATLAKLSVSKNLGHFFIGGAEGSIEKSQEFIRKNISPIRIAGWKAPWIESPENFDWSALAEDVKGARADIVWVGLGTPKQDFAVHNLGKFLDLPIIPIGAVFNVWSSEAKPSPKIFANFGIEWLHRLVQDPIRLVPRYFGSPVLTLLNLLFLPSSSKPIQKSPNQDKDHIQ